MKNNGANMEKVVLTMPAFGYSYYIGQESRKVKPGDEAMGPGLAGPYTQQPGFMSYMEVCSNGASSKMKTIFKKK